MSSAEEQFQQKLAELKLAFIKQLPGKIESLQAQWITVVEQQWSSDVTHTLNLLVHSLIGTSGTFGFTAISEKARQLEKLIKFFDTKQQIPAQEDIEIINHAFTSLCHVMHVDIDTLQTNKLITSSSSVIQNKKTKVLIIDDDTVLAGIIADHLRIHGFIVETLAHPSTLIDVVNDFIPSIILMDMVFTESKMAGAAAIEVLREHGSTIPVIFISVNKDMSSRLNAIKTGAYTYLTKPLDLDLLLSNIKIACNIRPDLPYRVLIVDDEKHLLDTHEQTLLKEGMLVSTLANPMKTLDVISDFKPELVLLDLHMPECSGIEVATIIRQNSEYDELPIVFLSSEEDINIRMMAIRCGSDDFISKPVNLDYLAKAVQTRIGKSRKLIASRNTDNTTIQKISSAKKLAEQANKTKSEFISKMSHELRTPLNTILGYTQLLEIDHDENLNEAQKNNIQHILSSGWHLLALINDILDISKIEINHLSLANAETNLDSVIRASIDDIKSAANNKKINITYCNECKEDATVYADTIRLKQVLTNILSNAIKYNTESGDINITVSDDLDDKCKVTISDSGRGLPEEKINQLFEPFNRLGLEETKIEGNGIGLALSSQLVKLMNGEIGAHNNKDAGSSFWFTLNQHQKIEISETSDNSIIKTLYIEENDLDFELVSKLLSAQDNIELLTARDAESALNLAHKMSPDVILLDIELSSMDGTTMLNALRTKKNLKQVPVFALSLNDVPYEQQALGDKKFCKYFSKPYNINLLIESIHDVLKNANTATKTANY